MRLQLLHVATAERVLAQTVSAARRDGEREDARDGEKPGRSAHLARVPGLARACGRRRGSRRRAGVAGEVGCYRGVHARRR